MTPSNDVISEITHSIMRMKMTVSYVSVQSDINGETVHEEIWLNAVCDNSDANKDWSKYTPVGNLHFIVTNKTCFGRVKSGDTLYIDLNKLYTESLFDSYNQHTHGLLAEGVEYGSN